MWRTSRQACLLCPWARHLTGCLHLHVADRWWVQAICPSWRPSLTEDLQTEHERTRSVCALGCFLISLFSTFQRATSFYDWNFSALITNLALFLDYGVIFMVPRKIITSFFAVSLVSRESFVIEAWGLFQLTQNGRFPFRL